MTIRWAVAFASAGVFVLAGCGGGGSSANPSSLSLSGLAIPTSQVVNGVKQLCAVAAQAHTDPVGSNNAFYGGPHLQMHQLVAILAGSHGAEANSLLATMVTYEIDLTKSPPPATTGSDADALVRAADQALSTLRVTPPTC